MLESSRRPTNYAGWPPMRLHSKLPRWKRLLLQLLYVQDADYQEGVHGMLDPRVVFGEAAIVRGEEERMILKAQGKDLLADQREERGCLQELKDQHL